MTGGSRYASCVYGDHCDVCVAEDVVISYRQDEDGNDIEETAMGDLLVLNPIETSVRTDDDDKLAKVEAAADGILAEFGWTRTGAWFTAEDALYAPVTR